MIINQSWDPQSLQVPTTQPEKPVVTPSSPINSIWDRKIPIINLVFLVLSLFLVFGVDLLILIGSPELFPYWIEMFIVFVLFLIFFIRENYKYRKKFSNSESHLDKWILLVIVIRNIVVLLNLIPLIQVIGFLAGVILIIPFAITYKILLSKRTKSELGLSTSL